MSVTRDEFEALTPIPYSQARSMLFTGDILLFHSAGLPLELAEHFTQSLWGHAAFVWRMHDVDSVLLLESVHRFGVRAVTLSNRINGSKAAPQPYPGKILVVRHEKLARPAEPPDVGKLARFAFERLGYPYSEEEIMRIGLRVAAGLVGETLPGHLEPQNAFVCSEYVAKCYEAMGISLAPDREGFIAPADLANDPDVYPVCALRPDAPRVGSPP